MKQGADDARREQDHDHDGQHVDRSGAVHPNVPHSQDAQRHDEQQSDGEDGGAHC